MEIGERNTYVVELSNAHFEMSQAQNLMLVVDGIRNEGGKLTWWCVGGNNLVKCRDGQMRTGDQRMLMQMYELGVPGDDETQLADPGQVEKLNGVRVEFVCEAEEYRDKVREKVIFCNSLRQGLSQKEVSDYFARVGVTAPAAAPLPGDGTDDDLDGAGKADNPFGDESPF